MVEETIKSIRETENKADQIVKEAEQESKRILKTAKEEAKQAADKPVSYTHLTLPTTSRV